MALKTSFENLAVGIRFNFNGQFYVKISHCDGLHIATGKVKLFDPQQKVRGVDGRLMVGK